MKVDEAISRLEIILDNGILRDMGSLDVEEYEEAIQQGISALEKQVAKKPSIVNGQYECGNCEEPIPRWDTRYCPRCGQKLDWSEI